MSLRALRISSPFLLVAVSWGQEPVPVVEIGDPIAGVGSVTGIEHMAVSDGGVVQVVVDTDAALSEDEVLLRDGVPYLREGQSLPAPAGATLDFFSSGVRLNGQGDGALSLSLAGSTTGHALYRNATLVLQRGDVTGAPEFPAGSTYFSFRSVEMNDSNQVAATVFISYPGVGGEYAAMRLDLDAAGLLQAEGVVMHEGQVAPGTAGQTVAEIGNSMGRTIATNAGGDLMFGVELAGGPAGHAIYLNTTLVALETGPSPLPGRSWMSLSPFRVDVGSGGDYVFWGILDGLQATNRVLIKNGVKFRQRGDALALPGGVFNLQGFGDRPPVVSDLGEVLWYGNWDDPDVTIDSGLFVDGELVVQEGVTSVGGAAINLLPYTGTPGAVFDTYTMSPNGRHVVFVAGLEDGRFGLYHVDRRALGGSYCTAAPNSTGEGSVLSAAGSTELADEDVRLVSENLPPGVSGLFYFGPNALQAPFGDGFRCVGGVTQRVQPSLMASSSGFATRALNFAAPYAANLAPGSTRFQLWYRDPMGPQGSGFNLSDGLEIVFN